MTGAYDTERELKTGRTSLSQSLNFRHPFLYLMTIGTLDNIEGTEVTRFPRRHGSYGLANPGTGVKVDDSNE